MVKEEVHPEDILEEEDKSPITYFLSGFVILLLIVMIIPHYAITLDPEPQKIPTIEEVARKDIPLNNKTHTITSFSDFINFVDPNNPNIRQTSSKIAGYGCDDSKLCQAKAITYFIRDRFSYVSDPSMEYIASAEETLFTQSGDCDDMAVLAVNLFKAIGIPARFVFVENHVFVQIKVDEAPKKYKQKNGWINIDPTCNHCKFSEISFTIVDQKKTYVG